MKRPLVLNTRPHQQSAALTRLLRTAGFEAVEMPATEIVPAWDAAELARIAEDLPRGAYAWLVLQSVNAARDLPLRRARILCGAATASALGVPAELTLERFSAATAFEALRLRTRPGDRVLVPRAAEGRDELINGLRGLGVQVDAPIAYRTTSSPLPGLRKLPIDVITVCSPSAADSLVRAVGTRWLAQRRVVCLGETTAQAVRDAGLRVDAVAQQTTMSSLVEAVGSVIEVPA